MLLVCPACLASDPAPALSVRVGLVPPVSVFLLRLGHQGEMMGVAVFSIDPFQGWNCAVRCGSFVPFSLLLSKRECTCYSPVADSFRNLTCLHFQLRWVASPHPLLVIYFHSHNLTFERSSHSQMITPLCKSLCSFMQAVLFVLLMFGTVEL